MVKSFLDDRSVPYELRRVGADQEATQAFRDRGWRLPPVVEVDSMVVEGYDPERLEALLDEQRLGEI